jgi:hypothetical protein
LWKMSFDAIQFMETLQQLIESRSVFHRRASQ